MFAMILVMLVRGDEHTASAVPTVMMEISSRRQRGDLIRRAASYGNPAAAVTACTKPMFVLTRPIPTSGVENFMIAIGHHANARAHVNQHRWRNETE